MKNRSMRKIIPFLTVLVWILLGSLMYLKTVVYAQTDITQNDEINLLIGELESLKVSSLTRVSITDPKVADVVTAESNDILIVARGVGRTALFIWDDQGKRALTVNVYSQKLDSVENRINKLFDIVNIKEVKTQTNPSEGKVVLSGEVPAEKQSQFDKIVGPFSDELISLAKPQERKDLIQLDMQITELNETLRKALGVSWGASGTTSTDGITLNYPETLPSTDGSIADFFKIGDFNRNNALAFAVQALLQEGKGHVLSQPRLVVANGSEASFLVGGQIPVRTTSTTQAGTTQENVSYKDYGISMTVKPVLKKEKIDINLGLEVSDIDATHSTSKDVAFTTRTAKTFLSMDDGQTIVLAGLIKKNKNENIRKVPFLGDIPIVGALFRLKSMPAEEEDRELVISLTPHILPDEAEGIAQNKIDVKETAGFEETSAAPVDATRTQEGSEVNKEEKEENSAAPSDGSADTYMPQEEESTDSPLKPTNSYSPPIPTNEPSEENNSPLEGDVSLEKNGPPNLGENSQQNATVNLTQNNKAVPEDMLDYVKAVQRKISQSIHYPGEAMKLGIEGKVKLGLLILNDGSLAFASVRESSGYEYFDDHAIEAAKKEAPYSRFPPDTDLQELNVTIPVVYVLNKTKQ